MHRQSVHFINLLQFQSCLIRLCLPGRQRHGGQEVKVAWMLPNILFWQRQEANCTWTSE